MAKAAEPTSQVAPAEGEATNAAERKVKALWSAKAAAEFQASAE